jgi:hypothetical protein
MEWSSIVSWRFILISEKGLILSTMQLQLPSYRLEGSCLLLPWALFTGSNEPILSDMGSENTRDDCDSSSCRSAEISGVEAEA